MSSNYIGRSASSSMSSFTYRTIATGDTTTSSGTDALLNSMTLTPSAGTYLVMFSSSMTSNAPGAAISSSFYIAGVQRGESLRKIIPCDGGTLSSGSGRGVMDISDIITVTGSQAIEIRWSISSGTATAHPRVMFAIKI